MIAVVLVGLLVAGALFVAAAAVSGCAEAFRQATDQTGEPDRLAAVASVIVGIAVVVVTLGGSLLAFGAVL